MSRARWKGRSRCVFTTQKSHAARETKGGVRIAYRRRGNQCNRWLSEERVRENDGIPICISHQVLYEEALVRDAKQRQALRDKYDPGPLY